MLEVACTRCDRRGRLRTTRLLAEHRPDLPIPALLRILAGYCPRIAAEVERNFGEGGLVTAASAKAKGMIDGVASWQEVVHRMMRKPGSTTRLSAITPALVIDDASSLEWRYRRARARARGLA